MWSLVDEEAINTNVMDKSTEVDKVYEERKEAESSFPDRDGKRITVVGRDISSEASVSKKPIADWGKVAPFGSSEVTGGHWENSSCRRVVFIVQIANSEVNEESLVINQMQPI